MLAENISQKKVKSLALLKILPDYLISFTDAIDVELTKQRLSKRNNRIQLALHQKTNCLLLMPNESIETMLTASPSPCLFETVQSIHK